MVNKIQLFFVALATILVAHSQQAYAQQPLWTYVSNTISNSPPADCSAPYDAGNGGPHPCPFFDQAINAVADGGSVSCVNVNNFSFLPYTISKSVTIDCVANGGGSDGQYFKVDAPGGTVRFRNMTLNDYSYTGSAASQTPPAIIEIVSAASVEFENVVLISTSTLPSTIGILDRRSTPGKLSIRNSVIVDNPGPGIVVSPAVGQTINVTLDNVVARNNSYGLALGRGARAMATRSIFSFNRTAGVETDTGAILEINDSLISTNGTGVIAGSGSSVSLANTAINSNATGISGATQSFGTNRIIRNVVADGTPPSPFGGVSGENGTK